jgi:thiol-disulfide isomerase/thioredoxin
MKPVVRAGAAVLVALLAGWAGERVYSALTRAESTQPSALTPSGRSRERATPAGSSDVPPDDAESTYLPPIKIPERLPAFTLADRSGKPTSIETWHGKSLILNFWATWCAPCRREIPLLSELSQQSGPDFAVIGVAVDHRDQVLAFADQFQIHYPLLIGEQDALDAASALGVESPLFPFTVFTDRRGEVVAVFVGELHRPQADLILSVVRSLDAHRLALTVARQEISDGLRSQTKDAGG